MSARTGQRLPPKLGDGIYSREFPESVIRNRRDFEAQLSQWISRYVSSGRSPGLIRNSVGIDEIINHLSFAPTTMNLNATRKVYVHFIFGQTADDGWWVKGVGFYMLSPMEEINDARRNQLRERLEDKAEERAMRASPPLQQIYFNPKDGSGSLKADLLRGKAIAARMIEHVYSRARKVAALMKNPIGPDMSDPASIVGELSKAVGGATLANGAVRKGFETAFNIADWGTKTVEYAKALGSKDKNVREGAGWKMIGDGLDLAIGSGNPVGALASTIVGSFIEIGIVNQAGEIAFKRGLIYLYFANGVMNGLVGQSSEKPSKPGQKEWFKIGEDFVRPLSELDCFCLHLALVDYAGKNNMSVWGLSVPKDPFHTIDDYVKRWSVGLVERSMLWQLGKKKYLVD